MSTCALRLTGKLKNMSWSYLTLSGTIADFLLHAKPGWKSLSLLVIDKNRCYAPHHQSAAQIGLHSSLTELIKNTGGVLGIDLSMTRQIRARLTQIHSIHFLCDVIGDTSASTRGFEYRTPEKSQQDSFRVRNTVPD